MMQLPFGFDPVEAEKTVKNNIVHNRVYIEVTVVWLKDGTMLPVSFTLNDKEYKINKTISIQKGHTMKIYALGFKYRCQTGRNIFNLFYDGERWYIESKNHSY